MAIIVLCGAVALVDGFDTQAIAFVAPHIAAAWGLAPATFGPVFAAGLLGSFIGALSIGQLGDRIGRKPALLLSIAIFGLASVSTVLANSVDVLASIRLVTGFGLGGALPCFVALASEYAPAKRRESMVSTMFCGFPIGAVIGGLASESIVAAAGWKGVFVIGGILPLVIGVIFFLVVPESIAFLEHRGEHEKVRRICERLAIDISDRPSAPSHGLSRASVAQLFAQRRAAGTLLLWATLFLSLLLTYLLINWIPLAAHIVGASVGAAVIAVALLNLGAVVGCTVIGRLADRYAAPRVIAAAYAAGAIAVLLIGQAQHSAAWLGVAAFLSGVLSIGAQMCTVSFCASFYSTSLRATGVGWAMGIGRAGAIVGPLLGGYMMAAKVDAATMFAVAAATSLGAAATVWPIARLSGASARHDGTVTSSDER
ncbi:MFS transporter [Paraburkholderia susongensis]|nr:MFS transporter [Paraburkholderia susongensis]